MGLVARVAEHPAGVLGGGDLGEAFGFGSVLLMAAAAEVGHVGELGFCGGGVGGIGMGGLGTVTGLAGDVGVTAGGADFGLILVAQDTSILAGVGDGARADELERGRPVMAILAEAFGDDGGTHNEEEAEGGEKDERGTDEMPGVAEETSHTPTPLLPIV